jgi:two-component system, NtrC family, sensor histidine kinase HydH
MFMFKRSFSLMRWFSVLSLICIGAACVLSSYMLSRFLTQQMLQRDGTLMLEFVQSVMDIENIKSRAAGREPDVRDHNMYELFDHLSGLPKVLRTNIYAPDQTLAWSSEKTLIGKRFDDNPELEKAIKGELEIESGVTSKHQHPKHEHTFLSDEPVRFVETYLPLRDKETDRVIAVAEIYRVPTALFETIERGRQLIWMTGVLSALILYATLFWIVRRADATIRSQQARLVESETLAAVGEMGSAVAHGIRNPLASIRSSAELCLDDKASPQTRESAGDIMAQVDRLEKWLRDLLNYAQPDSRTAARVQLDGVIQRVCEQFSRDFEKHNIQSTLALPPLLPPVVGDETAFEQVFTSIVANAMEAMPQGGCVNICASVPAREDTVLVTVSDTGVGIPERQQGRLFTAFHTTKPKGMGLGLALVRRIVRRFGGDVRIESAVGAGTTVLLTFAMPVAP